MSTLRRHNAARNNQANEINLSSRKHKPEAPEPASSAIADTPPVRSGSTKLKERAAQYRSTLPKPFCAFGSISQFREARHMAAMLARCSLVPEGYRGAQHLGDCMLALEIANRIGASVLAVMQNLQLYQGKPGWSSQFLISCVNATKRFSPIRYEMTGRRGEDIWGCIAWATDQSGLPLRSPEVTIKMAKEEEWYCRNGSKWATMPELMLCYRSAALFTRLYAPEMTMGIQSAEEAADVGPEHNAKLLRPIFEARPPRQPGKIEAMAQSPEVTTLNAPRPAGDPSQRNQPPVSSTGVDPDPQTPASEACRTPSEGSHQYLKALSGLIALSEHSETDILRFLFNTRRFEAPCGALAEVADKYPSAIVWAHDNWQALDREITLLKRARKV